MTNLKFMPEKPDCYGVHFTSTKHQMDLYIGIIFPDLIDVILLILSVVPDDFLLAVVLIADITLSNLS